MDTIPEATTKMIQEEAWNHFCAEANFTVGESLGVVRATFEKAINHALSHALEEGIVELCDDPRRSEMILSPTTWVMLAHEYTTNGTPEAAQELAQKVLDGKR